MNVCPVCGAANPAAAPRCLGCGEPLDARPEPALADAAPLPPLPDGGLAGVMPDWLRPEPAAAGAPSAGIVTATDGMPGEEPGFASASPPAWPELFDPTTLLTADDLPAWLRALAAAPGTHPRTAPLAVAPAAAVAGAAATGGDAPEDGSRSADPKPERFPDELSRRRESPHPPAPSPLRGRGGGDWGEPTTPLQIAVGRASQEVPQGSGGPEHPPGGVAAAGDAAASRPWAAVPAPTGARQPSTGAMPGLSQGDIRPRSETRPRSGGPWWPPVVLILLLVAAVALLVARAMLGG